MLHYIELFFELLFELDDFLEPYLLVTTIFFIPLTITITSIPKHFFKYEFTQHLLPSVYARYDAKKSLLEKINTTTQVLMVIILIEDVFGLAHFFFGSTDVHSGHEAGAHHESNAPEQAGGEAQVVNHGE